MEVPGMFSSDTYLQRRKLLRRQIGSGVILLLGNQDCPMNFADNSYPFRQDSTFLYFFGLDKPNLTGLIDIDDGTETVFGDDPTVDEIVWTGPQESLRNMCLGVGVTKSGPGSELGTTIKKARLQGRTIHFLPQYRPENIIKISQLMDIEPAGVQDCVSEPLIRAAVAQRSIKSAEEVEQIEQALEVTSEMQVAAMQHARPGIYEREIAGIMEGIAVSKGVQLAFPTIFSIHGETLHNCCCDNLMQKGNIAVNDSGVESPLHYASDITRTIPIGGKFSQRQKEIYSIVLNTQEQAIKAVKPGVAFKDVHLLACKALVSGLKELGLMKADSDEAVEAGAHTLFFPCGLGHMLGLDVHDMEALGEDYVGYTDTIKRNPEFGWKSLRLAKELEPGFVITVEPGIYFIPELIDRCRAEQKYVQYINYDVVEKYKDFGGIRIEDDVLVTQDGHRVLGGKIPKTIAEVEDISSR
jgi:Xaa-Pro aminopeptidase